MSAADHARVRSALERSVELGLIGTSVDEAMEHSRRFLPHLGHGWSVLDLGSGGGIPGLVIASERPDLRVTLLDSSSRRCDHLRRLVALMAISDRVSVVEGEAQSIARLASHRHRFEAVTARSFARPAVVAECAAPFLVLGGSLLVSSPSPAARGRWPRGGPKTVGLEFHSSSEAIDVLLAIETCSVRFPRRRLIPPLF